MESRNNYTTVNSKTWDVWSEHGCEWSIPVTHEDFERAKAGSWGVLLTPCKTVPKTGSYLLQGRKFWALPAAADSRCLSLPHWART